MCRKLDGRPAASARASSVLTTSYGGAMTAAACSAVGRNAANGRTSAVTALSCRLAEHEHGLVRLAAQAFGAHVLLAVVGRVREQRAVLHELESGRRDLALDRRRVDAVERRRVAPARAGLGVVIDDEIDAA